MPVNTRIQFRRGTAAAGANQWTNQVLYAGEVGFETDTGKFKIGDGTTAWNSLGYASVLPSELNELVDDRVNDLLVAGSNVTLTYNDNANTLTIAAAGTSAEDVQDIIGANLVAGSGISVSYNDGTGNTTISLSDPTIQVADITDLTASAAELNTLDGITASTAELNILDGVTSSASEINLLDGSVANTVVNGKAVVYGASGEVAVTSLSINGTVITSSGAELNILDGVTVDANELNLLDGSVANKVVNSRAVIYGSSGEVAVTTLSIGGTTVTSTAAELNILDGVTADANEINLLDGAAANTVVNSKAVIYGSAGEIAAASIATSGNVTVGGDLVVNGTTVTVNSTTTTLDDPILTLGGDTAPTTNDSKDRGVEFRWHNGSSAKLGFFGYDNSTGKFTFIPDATNTSEAFSGTTGELDAKIDWSNVNNKPDPVVSVDLTGDITGSGNVTLTDLASGTINITTSIAANSVTLGTDTTGDYVASVAVSGVGLSVSGSGENATYTVSSNATSSNTASTIVARDSSGNFTAGTITAGGLTGASAGSPVTISYAVIDGGTP